MYVAIFQLVAALDQCIKLKRFKEGWEFAKHINNINTWQEMGRAALRALDIDFGWFNTASVS